DIPAHNDEDLHKHGSSTVRYGRGSVLTVDLTNRCNMMCDPCFMDANQVGYVHELGWDEIKEILDNAQFVYVANLIGVHEARVTHHVGYVHELGWDEIKEILDNALRIKPRRQMSVQFSGGEPTMSPYFLDAVAYARKVG